MRLNCTFMELEFGFQVAQSVNREALIVSLWNWNNIHTLLLRKGEQGFNCTFMELK